MPIQQEDQEKYKVFLGEQSKLLQADVKPEDVLWHYTTGDSLLSIVESRKLFATQVSCLNDSTEIRYGAKLLRDAYIEILAKGSLQIEEAYLLETLIRSLVDEPLAPSHAPSWWYVTCFSKRRDDLSQWRAYSGGENGYAIGFRAGGLFGQNNSLVVRVNYAESKHKEIAANVATAAVKFFRDGLAGGRAPAHPPPELASDPNWKWKAWANEFLIEWWRVTNILAPMVKHPSFQDEDEYRIMHELNVTDLAELRFKQKSSLMSRFLPLVYPAPGTPMESQVLPITEIIVGPSRHKELSAMSIRTFMDQKGYNVPVSVSNIPFQTT